MPWSLNELWAFAWGLLTVTCHSDSLACLSHEKPKNKSTTNWFLWLVRGVPVLDFIISEPRTEGLLFASPLRFKWKQQGMLSHSEHTKILKNSGWLQYLNTPIINCRNTYLDADPVENNNRPTNLGFEIIGWDQTTYGEFETEIFSCCSPANDMRGRMGICLLYTSPSPRD